MLTAEELHGRGVAATNAGRVRRAQQLLQLARTRDPGADLDARISASLAYVVADLGDPASARALCEEALVLPGVRSQTRGVVAAQLALLHMRAGDLGPAVERFAQAIELLDELPADRGKALLNRGGVHLQRGELGAADRDFTEAAELLAGAGQPVEAAMAEHNRGYGRLLAGDLVEALRLMDSARPVLAPLSVVSRAIGDQDRAEVLMAAGLVAEARQALADAARAYGARRLRRRQGEAELVLARSLEQTEPETARATARAAARHLGSAGAVAWQRRAEAVAIEVALSHGRAAPQELADAETLVHELEEQGQRWRAASLQRHALLARLRRGELPEVRRLLSELSPTSHGPLDLRLLDRDVRAEVASARGRRAGAFRHLRAGLADLHVWQSSFGSLDLQTGVAGLGVRLGTRGLALAVESRKPSVLFEWSERARMLASRVQPVRAPADEQIVADLAELREIAAAEAGRDAEREAVLRQRIRERAWQHRGSGEVADPVTLDQLRDALDDDTALVAYVVTADQLVALVVTRTATTWIDLGDRAALDAMLGGLLPDLDVAATDLPDPMAGFVRTALAERLDSLATLLLAPVLEAVGDRQVVLTPSGVLAGVPWTLLPGFVGRPVTVAQSATSWLARRTTPLRLASAGFVAGPRVSRAEDEVVAAAKEWPDATVLVGDRANAAAVSDLAASVDVLHVAAHGRHAAENPLFSGLQLVDGPWFGYDIDRLPSVPDVVLLSACEVGRSTVRWGEELIGMATAWLHAGARRVIASPAAVNDRAAYDVLVAVHQQLAAGVDPATALAAAVPAVAADTAPVPLVCFG